MLTSSHCSGDRVSLVLIRSRGHSLQTKGCQSLPSPGRAGLEAMPAALRRNGWGLVPFLVALCDRSWLQGCCPGFLRDG